MDRETIWTGRIVTLELLGGRYEVARHASAVAILAVRDGVVLGVAQDRPAIGRRTWELPAGLIDPGEAPLEAAVRELRRRSPPVPMKAVSGPSEMPVAGSPRILSMSWMSSRADA